MNVIQHYMIGILLLPCIFLECSIDIGYSEGGNLGATQPVAVGSTASHCHHSCFLRFLNQFLFTALGIKRNLCSSTHSFSSPDLCLPLCKHLPPFTTKNNSLLPRCIVLSVGSLDMSCCHTPGLPLVTSFLPLGLFLRSFKVQLKSSVWGFIPATNTYPFSSWSKGEALFGASITLTGS